MKSILHITVTFILFSLGPLSYAASQNALALYYDEIEEGAGVLAFRYLISPRYLRIDQGSAESDYVLFDRKQKMIFSVNNQDRTILTIKHYPWEMPAFDFKLKRDFDLLKDAPKVNQQPVYRYALSVGEKICTQVLLIKQQFADEMQLMYEYQQVLSGQQVETLAHTPEPMRTPCFLVDQVYHSGEYYQSGLPVQITYSRAYMKILTNFEQTKVSTELFTLPQDYKRYSATP